jgi:YtkA-like
MRWCPNELALCLAVLSQSCGGSAPAGEGDETFPDAPYAEVASEQHRLLIEVRTSPEQPPRRGYMSVQLLVRDEKRVPVEGLTISATPWMPAMGHGASVEPTVSPEGAGKYVIKNVTMFMPGRWELHTVFTGPVMDSAVPVFDVP